MNADVFLFNCVKNKITRAKDKRKKVSSVRFEPGTSRFEMLNLAQLPSHHDHGIRLVSSHEGLGTYCQNCSFFEAGYK